MPCSSHSRINQLRTRTGDNSPYFTRICEGGLRGNWLFGISYLLSETFLSVGAGNGRIFVVFSQISPPSPRVALTHFTCDASLSLYFSLCVSLLYLALCAFLRLSVLFFLAGFPPPSRPPPLVFYSFLSPSLVTPGAPMDQLGTVRGADHAPSRGSILMGATASRRSGYA